jgi:hypothetical protein
MAIHKQPKVQAAEVTYELHSLGWKAFQQLCVAIVGEVWGQVVQSYFDSRDGGRDGAFHGVWQPKVGESYEGAFTAQCKFTAKADKSLRLVELTEELVKAERLAARGLADNYILFTNMRLTGESEEEIKQTFETIPGIKHFAAYGSERISQIIQETARLRMLVPRVYGLGDLSQILDERAYAQAQEILSALGDDLGKFVITEAYRKSAQALVEHGFVLLLGEPASGKSTIAAGLAVGALDEWGCSTIKIRDAEDFVQHSNPHEPKQFFWVDDAFGATQLDPSSAGRWNSVFPHLQAAIRRGARVVLTSRDYIYRRARNHLKEYSFPLILESQVVIQVERLTKEERDQILYNHIRLGTQSRQFKTTIKQYLPNVSAHQRFSPEIARRLGSPVFTKKITISKESLEDFVVRPMELLQEIIRTLDVGSFSALAVVFMRGGMMTSPITMGREEEKALTILGGTQADVRNAVSALEGSLLIQVRQGASYFWRFKHPTIRDAFAGLVAEDRELLDIYLTGTPIEKLFSEISCGDVELEGIKVIIPSDRYDLLIPRIKSFYNNERENINTVNRFLAYRCDCDFLKLYTTETPNFIENLQISSYLYAVSDVDLIIRLYEFGLLPEEKRCNVVATIRELAIDIPDSGFLREDIRQIFTPQEFDELLDYVRQTLLPNLDDLVENWEAGYNGTDDPDEYFAELLGALDDYKKVYKDDEVATHQIHRANEKIEEAIEVLHADMGQEPDYEDIYRGSMQRSLHMDSRSIFDDVDS